MDNSYTNYFVKHVVPNRFCVDKMMGMKYTYAQFKEDYPNDDACLESIFQNQFDDLKFCPKCAAETTFYRVKNRPSYACKWCGYQLYPLAGTIFRKTTTPLTSWFHAIYLFSVSKNGVSAKELERHLGVGYKTAWRMAKQIRFLMLQERTKLEGIIEIDEAYVGGHRRKLRGRGGPGKTSVIGLVERKGQLRAEVTKNTGKATVLGLMNHYLDKESVVYTDEYYVYRNLKKLGYKHESVKHSGKEYVRGNVHTNSIEGFWSMMKRSISGTYVTVSPKYLQSYINEFVFRYNFRDVAICPLLLELASRRPN